MSSSQNNMRKVLGPRILILLAVATLLAYSLRQQWNSVDTKVRSTVNTDPDGELALGDGKDHVMEGETSEYDDVEPASDDDDEDDADNVVDDYRGSNVDSKEDIEEDFFDLNKDGFEEDGANDDQTHDFNSLEVVSEEFVGFNAVKDSDDDGNNDDNNNHNDDYEHSDTNDNTIKNEESDVGEAKDMFNIDVENTVTKSGDDRDIEKDTNSGDVSMDFQLTDEAMASFDDSNVNSEGVVMDLKNYDNQAPVLTDQESDKDDNDNDYNVVEKTSGNEDTHYQDKESDSREQSGLVREAALGTGYVKANELLPHGEGRIMNSASYSNVEAEVENEIETGKPMIGGSSISARDLASRQEPVLNHRPIIESHVVGYGIEQFFRPAPLPNFRPIIIENDRQRQPFLDLARVVKDGIGSENNALNDRIHKLFQEEEVAGMNNLRDKDNNKENTLVIGNINRVARVMQSGNNYRDELQNIRHVEEKPRFLSSDSETAMEYKKFDQINSSDLDVLRTDTKNENEFLSRKNDTKPLNGLGEINISSESSVAEDEEATSTAEDEEATSTKKFAPDSAIIQNASNPNEFVDRQEKPNTSPEIPNALRSQTLFNSASLNEKIDSASTPTEHQENAGTFRDLVNVETIQNTVGGEENDNKPVPVAINLFKDESSIAANSISSDDPNDYPVFESPGFDDFRGFDIKYINNNDDDDDDDNSNNYNNNSDNDYDDDNNNTNNDNDNDNDDEDEDNNNNNIIIKDNDINDYDNNNNNTTNNNDNNDMIDPNKQSVAETENNEIFSLKPVLKSIRELQNKSDNFQSELVSGQKENADIQDDFESTEGIIKNVPGVIDLDGVDVGVGKGHEDDSTSVSNSTKETGSGLGGLVNQSNANDAFRLNIRNQTFLGIEDKVSTSQISIENNQDEHLSQEINRRPVENQPNSKLQKESPFLSFEGEAIVSSSGQGHQPETDSDVFDNPPGYRSRSLLGILSDMLDGFGGANTNYDEDEDNNNDDAADTDDNALEGGGDGGIPEGEGEDAAGYDDNDEDDNGGDKRREPYPYRLFIEEAYDEVPKEEDSLTPPDTNHDELVVTGDNNYEVPYYTQGTKEREEVVADEEGWAGGNEVERQNEQSIFHDHNNEDNYEDNNNNNDNINNDVIPDRLTLTNKQKQTTTPNNNGGSYDNPRPLTEEEYRMLHTQPYRKVPITPDSIISQGGTRTDNNKNDYDVAQTQNQNSGVYIEENQGVAPTLPWYQKLNRMFRFPFQNNQNNNNDNDLVDENPATDQTDDKPFEDLKQESDFFQTNNNEERTESRLEKVTEHDIALSQTEGELGVESTNDNNYNTNIDVGDNTSPLYDLIDNEDEGFLSKLRNQNNNVMIEGNENAMDSDNIPLSNDPRGETAFSTVNYDYGPPGEATLPRLSDCPVKPELSPVPHDVTALVMFPGALADWLKNAIEQISGELSDSLYSVIASLKTGDTSGFFQMTKRSVIHTHSAQSIDFDKAIVIINNPLAVEKKHLQFLPFAFEWRRYFLWDYTITSWLSSDVPLLVLTAEDIIADPEQNLRKIASFLNIRDERVDATLSCALLQKPPTLIDDVTKISGVYSRDRQRLSRSIDDVIEIASVKAPDILHRLFKYKTLLYI